MVFTKEHRFARWFIVISSFTIVLLFLWNTSIFFDKIKKEERDKMEIWVSAHREIQKTDYNSPLNNIIVDIISKNTTTPMIIYSVKDKSYTTNNIPVELVETQEEILKLISEFKTQYEPLKITDNGDLLSIVYYGNSDILNKLKYFPFIIILVVLLFITMVYYFYHTTKSSEQSKLWAGMAKETAHQIGTPLSSLVGWMEILKEEKANPAYIQEMEKDIDRLETITERFSKIGSKPLLEKTNLVSATTASYKYLKARSSKLIEFTLNVPSEEIFVNLNEQLFSWAVENLVKNAIDALRGRGEITLEIKQDLKYVHLYIEDNGKGIAKGDFTKIFAPGYTSKKRGWGLGLSLAKRIIEEYHDGKIRVLKSEVDKGTTFEIKLKKA